MSGKYIKIPIPTKVTSHGADISPWIKQSTYVQVFLEQSKEIKERRAKESRRIDE